MQVSSGSHPTWYIGVAVGVTVVATLIISWEVKRMLKKVVVWRHDCCFRFRAVFLTHRSCD